LSSNVIRHPHEGEVLSVVGSTMRVLVDSAATDGRLVVLEATAPAGNGPPLHRHGREDEFFFIVEGTVKFLIDGKETALSPGGSVLAARGSVHTFSAVGETPCRMIILCTPGGIESAFREVDQLTKSGKATPETITAAFKKVDLEFVGPPL
jgi:mannose-6-phosphate isomerase-like protein (cupin superfamily)